MIEKKKIPDADIEIIRSMDEQLESIAKVHHKVRKDFLRAEAVLLREHGTCERELKTFVIGVGRSLDITEADIKDWKLDLEAGEFIKTASAPEAEPELEVPEEVEPEVSKEERALQEIRKKYQR